MEQKENANADCLQRRVRHRATEAIAHAKKIAEKSQDWNLAWYVLRDLDAVKLAGLSDLAWAGHRDGNIHKNDLDGFIKDIEAWIAMPNEKS
jgi:hypothetical protein